MAKGTVFFRHRDGSQCRHSRPGRHPCPGGAWAFVVDVGVGSKRRQKKQGGFVTKTEAERAVQALGQASRVASTSSRAGSDSRISCSNG